MDGWMDDSIHIILKSVAVNSDYFHTPAISYNGRTVCLLCGMKNFVYYLD
jgi:hypothetical protein